MKFVLEIELGNAAMESPEDISDALKRVSQSVGWGYASGNVFDVNGNLVGKYEVKE